MHASKYIPDDALNPTIELAKKVNHLCVRLVRSTKDSEIFLWWCPWFEITDDLLVWSNCFTLIFSETLQILGVLICVVSWSKHEPRNREWRNREWQWDRSCTHVPSGDLLPIISHSSFSFCCLSLCFSFLLILHGSIIPSITQIM